MDAPASELPSGALASRRRLVDRIGDTALHLLTGAAALGSVLILATIAYRVIYGAWPAINPTCMRSGPTGLTAGSLEWPARYQSLVHSHTLPIMSKRP